MQKDFTKRPDGKYNFWKYTSVDGYSNQPVWVIVGVFDKLPKWASN